MNVRSAFLSAAVALLALPAVARAEGSSFAKGPFLQGLTTSSVVVRWEATTTSPASVVVKGPEGPSREFPAAEGFRFHSVEVAGLAPATTYSYVVKSGDATSPEGHFTTAPDDGRPFTFLAYGDNRTDPRAHESIVRAMLRVPSELLVHTGDMVLEGGDDEDWQVFFEIERPLLRDRCVFACVGNHELIAGGAQAFLRYFHPGFHGEKPSLHTTVRWGNSRFFFVNAMAPWGGDEERTWLDAELAKADAEAGIVNRFVVLHHGPFSSGPHGSNERFATAMLGALRTHKVTLVLAGHDHFYERGEENGIRYIVTGGGGAPLYKARRVPGSATKVLESAFHFVEVKVDGAKVTTIAHRPDGSTFESCSLVPGLPWNCDVALPDIARPEPAKVVGPPGEPPAKKACDCSAAGAGPGVDAGSIAGSTLLLAGALFRRAARRRRRRGR